MILKPEVALCLECFLQRLLMKQVFLQVFNLINGDGDGVGTYLSSHPDIVMISFDQLELAD